MSFFGEQLKYRKQRDDENFYDAVSSIAGAIMGTKLAGALSKKEIATSAIGEILAYFHHKPKYREIPDNIDTIDEQLEYCLRPFGIMRRRVELDKNWYRNAVGPMLGTFDGHAAALIPGRASGYYCIDYSTGKKMKVSRKIAAHIDSDAMCFYKALPIKPLTSRDLFVYMIQQLKASDVVAFIGATAAATLLGMLGPVFTKWLVGDVLSSKSMQVLVSVGTFMIFYILSRMLINVCKSFVNARISTKQTVSVRAAVISRLISLPTSFFKGYSSGEIVKRAAYVRSVCTLITDSVLSIGITSIFSLVYIGQIFAFAPSLVVPALIITIATFAVSLITALRQMKITREYMQLAAKTEGMTYSMITGIQKIKLAGAEKRMFSRWAKHYSEEAALEYNPPLLLKISPAILLGVSLFGTLILYAISIKTAVSATDYFAFNSCFAMVSAAFAELASIATMIASVKPALLMAKPILETVPEMTEGKTAVSSLSGNIELSHISFRYSGDMPNVIDDLSLKIKAGEYIAIVGSTGCGKSTLVRLLLGFEKPQKGAIYYDRRDLNQLDLKSLRRKIGTVMQDSKLFIGDIYSNIVITAPELSLDDAWEAAETASLAEDIRRMPMGMFTYISEGQGGISGGQKQRLMIARAVATKPKILILDEATSALDNITQKKVAEAIDKLKCTRIVIAHRLSTIKRCNRIVFLEGGKIVEDGSYDELIAKKGKFYELVERQRIENN